MKFLLALFRAMGQRDRDAMRRSHRKLMSLKFQIGHSLLLNNLRPRTVRAEGQNYKLLNVSQHHLVV
jgi:hypothetical protein